MSTPPEACQEKGKKKKTQKRTVSRIVGRESLALRCALPRKKKGKRKRKEGASQIGKGKKREARLCFCSRPSDAS